MDKRNELIKEWIHKADHDLGMAKLALEHQIEYADSRIAPKLILFFNMFKF
jgi:hypothetical protein